MNALSSCARMSLTLEFAWSSGGISHLEHFFIHRLNTWRDLFPGSFLEGAMDRILSETGTGPVEFNLSPGDVVPHRDPRRIITVSRDRLNDVVPFEDLAPGRFYPQGLVRGIPGVFRGNMAPFRCLEKTDRGIVGDFNHPLAGVPLKVTAKNPVLHPDTRERGGSCTDWMDLALTGPGMQGAGSGPWPDFFGSLPFERQDPSPDRIFYKRDRFVHHIDDRARQNLSRWYGRILNPGDRILDLMAGWDSHLPECKEFGDVHGLGLNAGELTANPGLTGFTVQDLNETPVLAFPDRSFDAVICSLSVEYLTDPLPVLREAARVLRPGGRIAISFSNRWFPEKAITLWTRLHEFERPAFVLAGLRKIGEFEGLSTYSLRGCPRPETDRYFPGLRLSDPLFGVTGRKMG